MTRPYLGTSWNAAVTNAYKWGYESFDESFELADEMQEIAQEAGERAAIDWAANDADAQQEVVCSAANKQLWESIDRFYKNHMPQLKYEQLQREAAVAEDLDAAFEAGAYDALLGRPMDYSRVHVFCK